MEESINEGEPNRSFRSPPRRRRSTFFDRRESIVPQPMSENQDPNVCKQTTDMDERHKQDMEKYYNKLLHEKEQWKKEVTRRRNYYHDIRQQYTLAAKAPGRSRMPYSALSNEDIEFLKSKPNISKLVESQINLHNTVKEARTYHKTVNTMDSVVLNHAEDVVNKITKYILENSTVEPKDESV